MLRIDGLQYINYNESVFKQFREAGLSAVQVTIAYHEDFRETVLNLEKWNHFFKQYSNLIIPGRWAEDIDQAVESKRTAVFFGLQTPSPIESDIGLIEILYQLGVRFMQLTYNNQSLLATGCYEKNDSGITLMGRQVIKEMNRVGMVVDMSHSAEKSTLEAIEISERPIAITHANPHDWYPSIRNKSKTVIKTLASSKGILGLSLYPHHIKDRSECRLESFCKMIRDLIDTIGIEHIAIGSDLCVGHPNRIVEWMRNGRWSREMNYGEGSKDNPGFPAQPNWFQTIADFPNLEKGMLQYGFTQNEIEAIIGKNWYHFYQKNFLPNKDKD